MVPTTAGTWNWVMLRQINFFLSRSHQCEDSGVRAKYEALARFFRAYFYFEKVKRFGDVPWYDVVVGSGDADLLNKPRDSRKFVMEKGLEDLDYAI